MAATSGTTDSFPSATWLEIDTLHVHSGECEAPGFQCDAFVDALADLCIHKDSMKTPDQLCAGVHVVCSLPPQHSFPFLQAWLKGYEEDT